MKAVQLSNTQTLVCTRIDNDRHSWGVVEREWKICEDAGPVKPVLVISVLTQDEAYKKLSEEEIPKYLSFLQRLLKENGDNGFFVSNSVSQTLLICLFIIW